VLTGWRIIAKVLIDMSPVMICRLLDCNPNSGDSGRMIGKQNRTRKWGNVRIGDHRPELEKLSIL
jgi:hypothetical protein